MDSRVRRITRELKNHDPDLFARRDSRGVIHVFRKKPTIIGHFNHGGDTYFYSGDIDQYIFSLTNTFKLEGMPVEWGLEPIMRWVHEIDGHNQGDEYEVFNENRRISGVWKQESFKQELRAVAADMRQDFARATNEFIVQK